MRHSPLLLSILAALAACEGSVAKKVCVSVPVDQETCPAPKDVNKSLLFVPNECGDFRFDDVRGPVTRESSFYPLHEASAHPVPNPPPPARPVR
jgi:hypothetical protein